MSRTYGRVLWLQTMATENHQGYRVTSTSDCRRIAQPPCSPASSHRIASVKLGKRQSTSLVIGAGALVAAMVMVTLGMHSNLHLPMMMLLAATAGFSSMAAP